ncbi:MAG: hypothetical protein WC529_00470 [Candidatus Margulisiibacteriota bacterium]
MKPRSVILLGLSVALLVGALSFFFLGCGGGGGSEVPTTTVTPVTTTIPSGPTTTGAPASTTTTGAAATTTTIIATTTTTTTTSLPDFAWTQATGNAFPKGVSQHTSVVFDGKMWVIGGRNAVYGQGTSEVWSSTDGATWASESVGSLPFLRQHSSVVYTTGVVPKIWVIGGQNNGIVTSEIWNSSDGVTWNDMGQANFTPRIQHSSIVFDGKIWAIGGNVKGVTDSDVPTNEVWSSTDGKAWTEVARSGGTPFFPPRIGHITLSHNGKLWVIGGAYNDIAGGKMYLLNDVWSSVNGSTWTREGVLSSFAAVTPVFSAEARGLGNGGTLSVDGTPYMFIFSGISSIDASNRYVYDDDLRYSQSGTGWPTATTSTKYTGRAAATSLVYNNKLWLIGGWNLTNTYYNDVWHTTNP